MNTRHLSDSHRQTATAHVAAGPRTPRPGARASWRNAGNWAIVTGASEGIGRAFAVELAAQGLHVVLVARREQALQQLAAELTARFSVQTRVVVLDLAHAQALSRLIRETADLDVGMLVAAAGYGSSGPLIECNLESELAQLQVNAAAVLGQCVSFGRLFAAQGAGAIVLLSSVVAFQGVPASANYAASKAYVQSLAEALRHELAPRGVEVIACAPGPVASGFAKRAGLHMPRTTPADVVARETLRAIGRTGTVRPGVLSRVLGWSLATAPRPWRVRIMGRIMAGMAGAGAGGRTR